MTSKACPRCSSENTTSYEMAYSSGTRQSGLIGTDLQGDVFVGVGTSSSTLASSCAPPKKASETLGMILIASGILFGVIGIGVLATSDISREVYFRQYGNLTAAMLSLAAGISLASFGFVAARNASRFNTREFPLQYQRWRQWFICLRCGHRFNPSADPGSNAHSFDPVPRDFMPRKQNVSN